MIGHTEIIEVKRAWYRLLLFFLLELTKLKIRSEGTIYISGNLVSMTRVFSWLLFQEL